MVTRSTEPLAKPCRSCGRTITWRKKWERDWDEVRYCSTACRRRGLTEEDEATERLLVQRLTARGLRLETVPGDRETVRRAARRLAAAGRVRWTQAGREVDPSTARGDVLLRRA